MRKPLVGLVVCSAIAFQAPAWAAQNMFEPVLPSANATVKASRPLDAYAGTFGPATMLVEKGQLFAKVPEGLRKLTPLGGNAFSIEGQPGIRAEFQFEGGALKAVEIVRPDGNRMRVERSS